MLARSYKPRPETPASKLKNSQMTVGNTLQCYVEMRFLILICALMIIAGELGRVSSAHRAAGIAQKFCMNQAPRSDWRDLYGAIVCGGQIENLAARQAFLNSGLIHLLVVSGSHLVFLEVLLRRFPVGLVWLVLIVFSLMTGFQAPAVRALMSRFAQCRWFSSLHMTPVQMQCLSTALSLALVPAWIQSPSFLLSWMCGLLLSFPNITNTSASFESAVRIYLGLIPFSVVIGISSPLVILANWLIAPFMGLWLFPASLISFLIPGVSTFTDVLWYLTIRILNQLPFTPATFQPLIPMSCLFFVPLILHATLLYIEVQWNRKKLF